MPPPSKHNIQGSHGSFTPLAQTRPAFSESVVSGLRGALGARLELRVCSTEGADSVAVLSSIGCAFGSEPRKAQGAMGMESRLELMCHVQQRRAKILYECMGCCSIGPEGRVGGSGSQSRGGCGGIRNDRGVDITRGGKRRDGESHMGGLEGCLGMC